MIDERAGADELAELLEAERRARATAEDAKARQVLVANALQQLSSSLDVDSVLTTLAHLVVPAAAAWSVVTLVDANGNVELAAAAGRPPRDYECLGRRFDLRTKQAASATLFAGGAGEEALRPDDVSVIEDITMRAAIAVDNALLYSEQRDAALTLQQALLPRDRPRLRDLDYAIRYLPATSGSAVGGDFYDITLLDPTNVAISVGDVQGKGVRAAAHMGQVRAAARAYTHAGLGPGAVLQFLDRMWEQQSEVLVTYLHAQLDLSRGTGRIATAGHLPPIRFGGGREPGYLEVRPGPPIGSAGGVYLESMVTIPPGGGIALFTDGLVEHRKRSIDDGLAALRDVVRQGSDTGDDPEDMAERIVEALLPDGPDDDVALIVLRRSA